MAKPYRWKLAGFFGLTFLGLLAWTASPYVVSLIITRLGTSPKIDKYIWVLVIIYFVLRILDEGLWRLGEFLARTFKPQMIERVRTILFAATLRKPHEYFVNSSSGRVAHWINATTETTNEFVDTTFWNVWGRVVGLTMSAGFLFLVHWSLALLFIVWLVLLFWYNVYRGKRFSQLISTQSDHTSRASGIVVDSLTNNLSVRVFNARSYEEDRLRHEQQLIIHAWRKSWWQNLVTSPLCEIKPLQSANLA
jgi:ATP-binding cassette, subfamily B, bacterial